MNPQIIGRLRLASGIALFAYVLTHLLNHALGLVSLPVLEQGRVAFLWLWRNPIGTTILYGSLLIHFLLALWAVYRRRRLLRMPAVEAAQLLLGLCVVPLLTEHVLGTRVVAELYGSVDSYRYVLLVLWLAAPVKGATQALALIVAWIHGCIGLYFNLRLKPWYPRWVAVLYAIALLVPILALIGFLDGGREVLRLAESQDWLVGAWSAARLPDREAAAELVAWRDRIWIGFAACLALTLALRQLRFTLERRRGMATLTYPDGRRVVIAPGLSVLETSQLHGIPHASVCGGRGRCSTCRFRAGRGADRLAPPSPEEAKVLKRVGAAPDVRLACQTRPSHDLDVTPLLPASATARDGFRRPSFHQGQEQEIAILFVDIRKFTRLAEKRLPYDIVFILNRYFNVVGKCVESAGGTLDKFIGDGVMALFGVASDKAIGCRQAMAAARAIAIEVDALNRTLEHELERPLKIGIGIHVGPVIVGELGYARVTSVTAIGDAVNTASRLEQLTKDYEVQLVVSEEVAAAAGIDLSAHPAHQVEIRGRRQPLVIRAIADAASLPLPTGNAVAAEAPAPL